MVGEHRLNPGIADESSVITRFQQPARVSVLPEGRLVPQQALRTLVAGLRSRIVHHDLRIAAHARQGIEVVFSPWPQNETLGFDHRDDSASSSEPSQPITPRAPTLRPAGSISTPGLRMPAGSSVFFAD